MQLVCYLRDVIRGRRNTTPLIYDPRKDAFVAENAMKLSGEPIIRVLVWEPDELLFYKGIPVRSEAFHANRNKFRGAKCAKSANFTTLFLGSIRQNSREHKLPSQRSWKGFTNTRVTHCLQEFITQTRLCDEGYIRQTFLTYLTTDRSESKKSDVRQPRNRQEIPEEFDTPLGTDRSKSGFRFYGILISRT